MHWPVSKLRVIHDCGVNAEGISCGSVYDSVSDEVTALVQKTIIRFVYMYFGGLHSWKCETVCSLSLRHFPFCGS